MSDQKLTIDLRGVGNDIPTRLGKSRPTLTSFKVQVTALYTIPHLFQISGYKTCATPYLYKARAGRKVALHHLSNDEISHSEPEVVFFGFVEIFKGVFWEVNFIIISD